MKNFLLFSLTLATCHAFGMKQKSKRIEKNNKEAKNIRDVGMHLPYYKGDNDRGTLCYSDKNVDANVQYRYYDSIPELIRDLRDTLRMLHTSFNFNTHYELRTYFNNNNELALIHIATDACNIMYYPESQYTTINNIYQRSGSNKFNRIIKGISEICTMFHKLKF